MRKEASRLLHGVAAPYFLCMDVIYFFKLIEVFTTRSDLFFMHVRGLGLQFFTVWSQAALQIYFFVTFVYDIIEPSKSAYVKHVKRVLWYFRAVFFTSVVIPSAVIVSVNYWGITKLLDPNLVENTNALQDFVPLWMDHSLHTSVVFFAFAELILCYRPYPRWIALGQMRSIVVVLAYTTWVTFAVLIGSSWPYPYLGMMSVCERLAYLLINCMLAVLSYNIGGCINSFAWRRRNKII